MPILQERVSESLTLALLGRVREMRAQGIDVASLAAGEPDFPTPDFVIEGVQKSLKAGNTKYVASQGLPHLREGIARDYRDRLGASWVKAENIVITAGAKQGLHLSLAALLNLGDEVLVPSPYWVSYPSLIKATGGVVKTFSTLEKNKFFPTAAELEKQYTPKTKALIFSSPGNPSGMMIDAGLLKEILDWCRQKKVELIYDEIYERLALTDVKHISAAALDTTQGQDAMCVNAFSKSLAMTGWRLGYVVSHPQTIKALTALQTQFLTCVPGFIQDAAGWSMDRMEAFLVPVLEAYRRRLKLMLEGLAKIPGVKAYVPDGAFYVMLDIQKVIQSKGFRDDAHFAEALLGQEKTVVIPGGAMGAPGCVRLSFSTSDEEISKAIERLARFSKF